ncbi:MAG: choice-of-anchor T family protein [Thermoplasmatota archaeon]
MKMIRMKTSRLVLMISLVMAVSLTTLISDDVESMKILPSISIIIEMESTTADVDPGSDGIVEINGAVRLDRSWPPGYEDIVIDIRADAGGWETEVPERITFTEESHGKEITIVIQVPPGTSSSTKRNVTISGEWYSESADDQGSVNSDEVRISVNQYRKFELTNQDPSGSLKQGEETGFTCNLTNLGNGHDRISIEVLNNDDLETNAISVELSQDKFQLEEASERMLAVNVKAGIETVPGTYQIRIRAISADAEQMGEEADASDLVLNVQIESGSDDLKTESSPFLDPINILFLLGMVCFLLFLRKRSGPS